MTHSQESRVSSTQDTLRLCEESSTSEQVLPFSGLATYVSKLSLSAGDGKLSAVPKSKDVQMLENTFPWLNGFSDSCRKLIGSKDIKGLENLLTVFSKHISIDVENCYKKPNRAAKLKKCMSETLLFFHMFYQEVKQPLEHSYLNKMTDLMAMYFDMEVIASRRKKETTARVISRLTTSLYIFLDHSEPEMLDVILKAKLITKANQEICTQILSKLMSSLCAPPIKELMYVRCILVYKQWKKIVKGATEKQRITDMAVQRLSVPITFLEKTKVFTSGVLPKVPKSQTNITLFFMQAKIDLEKSRKAFPKLCEDSQPSQNSMFFRQHLEDTPSSLGIKSGDMVGGDGRASSLLNSIWSSLSDSKEGNKNLLSSKKFKFQEKIGKRIKNKLNAGKKSRDKLEERPKKKEKKNIENKLVSDGALSVLDSVTAENIQLAGSEKGDVLSKTNKMKSTEIEVPSKTNKIDSIEIEVSNKKNKVNSVQVDVPSTTININSVQKLEQESSHNVKEENITSDQNEVVVKIENNIYDAANIGEEVVKKVNRVTWHQVHEINSVGNTDYDMTVNENLNANVQIPSPVVVTTSGIDNGAVNENVDVNRQIPNAMIVTTSSVCNADNNVAVNENCNANMKVHSSMAVTTSSVDNGNIAVVNENIQIPSPMAVATSSIENGSDMTVNDYLDRNIRVPSTTAVSTSGIDNSSDIITVNQNLDDVVQIPSTMAVTTSSLSETDDIVTVNENLFANMQVPSSLSVTISSVGNAGDILAVNENLDTRVQHTKVCDLPNNLEQVNQVNSLFSECDRTQRHSAEAVDNADSVRIVERVTGASEVYSQVTKGEAEKKFDHRSSSINSCKADISEVYVNRTTNVSAPSSVINSSVECFVDSSHKSEATAISTNEAIPSNVSHSAVDTSCTDMSSRIDHSNMITSQMSDQEMSNLIPPRETLNVCDSSIEKIPVQEGVTNNVTMHEQGYGIANDYNTTHNWCCPDLEYGGFPPVDLHGEIFGNRSVEIILEALESMSRGSTVSNVELDANVLCSEDSTLENASQDVDEGPEEESPPFERLNETEKCTMKRLAKKIRKNKDPKLFSQFGTEETAFIRTDGEKKLSVNCDRTKQAPYTSEGHVFRGIDEEERYNDDEDEDDGDDCDYDTDNDEDGEVSVNEYSRSSVSSRNSKQGRIVRSHSISPASKELHSLKSSSVASNSPPLLKNNNSHRRINSDMSSLNSREPRKLHTDQKTPAPILVTGRHDSSFTTTVTTDSNVKPTPAVSTYKTLDGNSRKCPEGPLKKQRKVSTTNVGAHGNFPDLVRDAHNATENSEKSKPPSKTSYLSTPHSNTSANRRGRPKGSKSKNTTRQCPRQQDENVFKANRKGRPKGSISRNFTRQSPRQHGDNNFMDDKLFAMSNRPHTRGITIDGFVPLDLESSKAVKKRKRKRKT